MTHDPDDRLPAFNQAKMTALHDRIFASGYCRPSCSNLIEQIVGDRVRVSCATCKRFYGYRPNGGRAHARVA